MHQAEKCFAYTEGLGGDERGSGLDVESSPQKYIQGCPKFLQILLRAGGNLQNFSQPQSYHRGLFVRAEGLDGEGWDDGRAPLLQPSVLEIIDE